MFTFVVLEISASIWTWDVSNSYIFFHLHSSINAVTRYAVNLPSTIPVERDSVNTLKMLRFLNINI